MNYRDLPSLFGFGNKCCPSGVFRFKTNELFKMPESYVNSSAGFWGNGIQGIFPVDNILDIMEIDLSKRI
jgi:hypothetical protein